MRRYQQVLHDFLVWRRCPICEVSFSSDQTALVHEQHCFDNAIGIYLGERS